LVFQAEKESNEKFTSFADSLWWGLVSGMVNLLPMLTVYGGV